MAAWMRYLIAFVVACHGYIYIPFGIAVPGKMKEWRGTSRLLSGAVTGERLRRLVLVLHVLAGVVVPACAAVIAFAPSVPGLWRSLAIAGGVLGLAAFASFWDGQGELLAEEGMIGAMFSLVLVVGGVAFGGMFG